MKHAKKTLRVKAIRSVKVAAPAAPVRSAQPKAPKAAKAPKLTVPKLSMPKLSMPNIGRGPAAVRRRRMVLWPLVGVTTLLGMLVIGVFPTRTFLAQRGDLSDTASRLEVLEAQNAKLEARAHDLTTDAEIEALARQQYNLVRPGEEAYAILPAPDVPVQVPNAWPFIGLHAKLAQLVGTSG